MHKSKFIIITVATIAAAICLTGCGSDSGGIKLPDTGGSSIQDSVSDPGVSSDSGDSNPGSDNDISGPNESSESDTDNIISDADNAAVYIMAVERSCEAMRADPDAMPNYITGDIAVLGADDGDYEDALDAIEALARRGRAYRALEIIDGKIALDFAPISGAIGEDDAIDISGRLVGLLDPNGLFVIDCDLSYIDTV